MKLISLIVATRLVSLYTMYVFGQSFSKSEKALVVSLVLAIIWMIGYTWALFKFNDTEKGLFLYRDIESKGNKYSGVAFFLIAWWAGALFIPFIFVGPLVLLGVFLMLAISIESNLYGLISDSRAYLSLITITNLATIFATIPLWYSTDSVIAYIVFVFLMALGYVFGRSRKQYEQIGDGSKPVISIPIIGIILAGLAYFFLTHSAIPYAGMFALGAGVGSMSLLYTWLGYHIYRIILPGDFSKLPIRQSEESVDVSQFSTSFCVECGIKTPFYLLPTASLDDDRIYVCEKHLLGHTAPDSLISPTRPL